MHTDIEPDGRDGFVIVIAAADQGLIDINDRKPLTLAPELAREWMDLDTPAEGAAEIMRSGCRPAEDFQWHPVEKAFGNVRNQGATLIQPIAIEGPE